MYVHVVLCVFTCVCVFVCVSERGLILQQFIQQGSVTVANAHSSWRYVLQDVYRPPQPPVYVVGVPRWVTLPGHVDLYKWTLWLRGGGHGPHLEHRKTRLGHILFRLRLGHVGRSGWSRGWG